MKSLRGKVALVTGASKGIGRATAMRLAEDGADLVIGATRVDLLETLKKDVQGLAVQSLAKRCDVTDLSECKSLVETALKKFGRIDILVNNAGAGFSGKIVDSDPGEVEQMVKVNILGSIT
jgi:3-oxoacyl-[acyl-carrier protein] reductase